jgi:Zn-dependent peptidase ImmA (M78 family)/DNA-binding XRE family transcriptional regulator
MAILLNLTAKAIPFCDKSKNKFYFSRNLSTFSYLCHKFSNIQSTSARLPVRTMLMRSSVMQNFPSRLRAARKMAGLTLEDLSGLLGHRVTKQALNKYEQDTMKPDSDLLLPLCEALGVRPDYFTRAHQVNIEHYSFRKLAKLQKREQAMAIEKTRDAVERYFELEDLLGMEQPFEQHIPGLDFVVSDADGAEQAALLVRQAYQLGNGPLYNVVEMLEEKGIRVIEIELDEGFNGMSAMIDDRVPVIVLNSFFDNKLDRKRFTTLHELAHLLIRFDPELEEKQQERLCDAFAGAMLLPGEQVRTMLGSHRSALIWNELVLIKELYGISIRAILYRARKYDIITDYDLTSKMAELSRFYGRKREPGQYKGAEKAVRFRQLLLRAIAEAIISESKAAELDGKKLAEFRESLKLKNPE